MFNIIKILFGRGKQDISRKLLRLIFFGSFLIFLVIGIISIIGMVTAWFELEESGEKIGKVTADYVENHSKEKINQNLQELVKNRAALISLSFEKTMFDVQLLSNEMTKILTAPQNYSPRKLKNANFENVYSGEAYVHFNQDLIKSGITPELQQEINIASNAEDILLSLSKYYPSVMAGSKNGYVVKLDTIKNKNELLPICREPVRTNYNIKEREWYKLGQKVTAPKFTNPYVAQLTGLNCISCVMPYYNNSGFAGVVAADINLEEIYSKINSTLVGENIYCFIVDSNGKVIFSSNMEEYAIVEKNLTVYIPELLDKLKSGASGAKSVDFFDEGQFYESYFAYEPIKNLGWEFCTLLKKSEVVEPARVAKSMIISQFDKTQFNLGVVFVIIAIIAAAVVILLLKVMMKISADVSKKFVEPINELSDGVREIASGNFDKKLEIHTNDEIEHLATCFNSMTDELKNYMANVMKVTAENEKAAAELDIAKDIQNALLKNKIDFNRREFEIFTTMKTSKDAGGGFCDFYPVDENNLIFMIIDVSAKGVPAALYMLVVKTILRNVSLTMSGVNLEEMLNLANRQLCENNEAAMFSTIFIGMLDLQNGNLHYINAGHKLPLIYRRNDEKFVYLKSVKKNFALGINETAKFRQEELTLNAGDIIFLYTDSLIEVTNEADEIFNQKRLEEFLNSEDIKNSSPQEILQAVLKKLENFAGNKKISDGLAIVDMIYRGKQND